MKQLKTFLRDYRELLLVVGTIVVFFILYFPISLPHGQPTIGHTIAQDADVDILIPLSILRGEGLYEGFSIVYPPGRYLLEASLFHFFGNSYPIISVYKIATTLVFFPIALFLMAYVLFRKLIRSKMLVSYGLALATAAIYLMFIRSAQETHVFAALFFALLLYGKSKGISKWIKVGLGVLFGIVALFRVDAGIFLGAAVSIPLVSEVVKHNLDLRKAKNYIYGFGIVWVPVFLGLILNGSVGNFFYDAFILGLIHQPRVMSIPIPINELRLVFQATLIFLSMVGLTVYLDAKEVKPLKDRIAMQAIAVFGVLSYVGALGRSDEPHLWYGLAWLSFFVVYAVYRLVKWGLRREHISIYGTIFTFAGVLGYSWLVLEIKQPLFFLVTTSLIFLLFTFKKRASIAVLIGGLIATFVVFHSVSYLKLRFFWGMPSSDQGKEQSWITNEENEFIGFVMQEESKKLLDQIQADIPVEEEYIFVYPENLFLYEYLPYKNPTRYQLLAQTTSERTESETIEQIQENNVTYFLIFQKSAKERNDKVKTWLDLNTEVTKTYLEGDLTIELRQRTTSL